jgi:hypothetical protein
MAQVIISEEEYAELKQAKQELADRQFELEKVNAIEVAETIEKLSESLQGMTADGCRFFVSDVMFNGCAYSTQTCYLNSSDEPRMTHFEFYQMGKKCLFGVMVVARPNEEDEVMKHTAKGILQHISSFLKSFK